MEELADKDEREMLEETLDALEELNLSRVAVLKGGFANYMKKVKDMK